MHIRVKNFNPIKDTTTPLVNVISKLFYMNPLKSIKRTSAYVLETLVDNKKLLYNREKEN